MPDVPKQKHRTSVTISNIAVLTRSEAELTTSDHFAEVYPWTLNNKNTTTTALTKTWMI